MYNLNKRMRNESIEDTAEYENEINRLRYEVAIYKQKSELLEFENRAEARISNLEKIAIRKESLTEIERDISEKGIFKIEKGKFSLYSSRQEHYRERRITRG